MYRRANSFGPECAGIAVSIPEELTSRMGRLELKAVPVDSQPLGTT